MSENLGEIIIYQTDDGLTKIETKFEQDTVWLALDQIAELFQRDKSTVSRHIKNVFEEERIDNDNLNEALQSANMLLRRQKKDIAVNAIKKVIDSRRTKNDSWK